MAITFIGYYRPIITGPDSESRRGGTIPTELRQKVHEFPSKLPATCKLIGSWECSGGVQPGCMIVEAESYADLQHINSYYSGWIGFDWHPTVTGGVARA